MCLIMLNYLKLNHSEKQRTQPQKLKNSTSKIVREKRI